MSSNKQKPDSGDVDTSPNETTLSQTLGSAASADLDSQIQDLPLAKHSGVESSTPPQSSSTTEPSSSSFGQFTCFPKLPPELRLAIWHFSLPERRYINIVTTAHYSMSLDGRTWHRTWHPTCIENAPAQFFTCQESRAVVCKDYEPLRSNDGSGAVWVDLRKDALCFFYHTYTRNTHISTVLEQLRDRKMRQSVTCLLADFVFKDERDEVLISWPGLRELLMCPFDVDGMTMTPPEVDPSPYNRRILAFEEDALLANLMVGIHNHYNSDGGVNGFFYRMMYWYRKTCNETRKRDAAWKEPLVRAGQIIREEHGFDFEKRYPEKWEG